LFRSPVLSDDAYEQLHRTGVLDVRDTEQRREGFRLIRQYLRGFDGKSIADSVPPGNAATKDYNALRLRGRLMRKDRRVTAC
jgi:hypothetical protein